MNTKMRTTMLNILLAASICGAVLFLNSCEQTVYVSAEPNPILQVDAVIYNNRPLPVIEIKQSFTVSGREEFYLEEEELYVSGAEVILTHNGDPVAVREVSPGMYQPESDQTVEMGDQVHISVSFEGKTVSAEAEVPKYPVDEMVIRPSGIADFMWPLRMEQWVYMMPVEAELPFVADFTALQIYMAGEDRYCWPYCENTRHFGEQYSEQESLLIRQEVYILIPVDEEETEEPPTGNITIPLYVNLQIPEPVYVDYTRSYSDELVTNTVTNVDGGVGLFIGAILVEKEIDIEVELTNR